MRLISHLSDSEYIVKEFPNTISEASRHLFGNIGLDDALPDTQTNTFWQIKWTLLGNDV